MDASAAQYSSNESHSQPGNSWNENWTDLCDGGWGSLLVEMMQLLIAAEICGSAGICEWRFNPDTCEGNFECCGTGGGPGPGLPPWSPRINRPEDADDDDDDDDNHQTPEDWDAENS